ncbi:hypothetical protein [Pseudodesulfovibrio sediminis]|nr:hypothetical protein [Pseudodesulfovibrio sediminis]
MKKYMKGILPLCLILLFAVGCAKNTGITLTYPNVGVGASCSGDIVILQFADNRPTMALGKYSDGTRITTGTNVADWVGWALFDELEKAGCKPRYRTSSVSPGDAMLVTGEVLSVELNQTGTTTYTGKVTVKIVITRAGQRIHVQKYASQVDDVVVLGYANEADLMAETLRGIMTEAVPVIAALGSNPM